MIKLLDCTLRDGGYANDWEFGKENIQFIAESLIESDVEIIECGYVKQGISKNEDSSIVDFNHLPSFLKDKKSHQKNVYMINFGDYEIEQIPEKETNEIDGFRIAFHKKDVSEAVIFCRELHSKGYDVFVQPMITNTYSDQELLDLITKVNGFSPYAFYIVDSFGVLKEEDVLRMTYLIHNNLEDNIALGFHGHNNQQLAYSNAQMFLKSKLKREIIIDSSIYGMGRGAGNLNTELVTEFLNENYNKKYKLTPLLKAIDYSIFFVYERSPWGYSLPYYLSALNKVHPNYASYLSKKSKLTVNKIGDILSQIPPEEKGRFNKKVIDDITSRLEQLNNQEGNSISLSFLKNAKEVLLIGPGSSILSHEKRIKEYISKNSPIVIGVNVYFEYVNYVFINNQKRLDYLQTKKTQTNKDIPWILTFRAESVENNDVYLLNNEILKTSVTESENALIQILEVLIHNKIESVTLAGFDGYKNEENYYDDFEMPRNIDYQLLNDEVIKALKLIKDKINIKTLTETIYL